MAEIRKMRVEDIDQVAVIEKEAFSIPWTKEGLRSFFDRDDTQYLVAEKEGEILGYCGYLAVIDEADILNVAVKSEYRGQHIGTELVKRLIEEGQKAGIFRFTLEVRQSNSCAIHLYEKAGFVAAGIRKNFYEKPIEHAVIMWKE